jgi:3alpha(or 20beta)-hydroxysteroid dehydrogenase
MTAGFSLEGRVGLVTGGTSDIGGACVERLCEAGMAIAFTGSDNERGEALAAETGATFFRCDPGDRASTDDAVQRALALSPARLDVLVTNSDTRFNASLQATSEADFRRLVEVNLTSVFRTARACFVPMRSSGGGSVIHVTSTAGLRADHEAAAYSVASAGVIAVAELLAAEGGTAAIRANAVCPGGLQPRSDPMTLGEDVASVVAWLACDQSAHVSGATVRVDGGEGAAMVVDTRV